MDYRENEINPALIRDTRIGQVKLQKAVIKLKEYRTYGYRFRYRVVGETLEIDVISKGLPMLTLYF